MNKTLLLVICDFLLLSLLALARFDLPEEARSEEKLREVEREAAVEEDLIEMLKMTLELEETGSEILSNRLQSTEQELDAVSDRLDSAVADLDETSSRLAESRLNAGRLEREREDLSRAKKAVEDDKSRISKHFQSTQEELLSVERERGSIAEALAKVREEAAAERERVRFVQEQLQDKAIEITQAGEKIQALEGERNFAQNRSQRLETELQIVETENRMLEQNLISAEAQIQIVRVEKDAIQKQTSQLVEGVAVLAESSSAIHEEIRQIQPLSANTIFKEFTQNRGEITFSTVARGGKRREVSVPTTLVSSGEATIAVFDASETPFRLVESPSKYRSVSVYLNLGGRETSLGEVAYLSVDPRVMAARVDPSFAEEAGAKTTPLSLEPYRFSEAVLISDSSDYYGESSFKIETSQSDYLKMQGRLFNRLFGEFSPAEGDFVFAKSGDILGLMVNNQYCVLLDSLSFASRIPVGSHFSQEEADTASRIGRAILSRRPAELQ